MIILQESGSAQNINFIPRQFTANSSYTIKITDETQNKEVYSQATTSISQNLYFNRFNAVFPVKQDIYYTLKILSGTTTVFMDKIYCTNQTDLPAYTINNGEYTSNATTNEFITL